MDTSVAVVLTFDSWWTVTNSDSSLTIAYIEIKTSPCCCVGSLVVLPSITQAVWPISQSTHVNISAHYWWVRLNKYNGRPWLFKRTVMKEMKQNAGQSPELVAEWYRRKIGVGGKVEPNIFFKIRSSQIRHASFRSHTQHHNKGLLVLCNTVSILGRSAIWSTLHRLCNVILYTLGLGSIQEVHWHF